MPIQQILTSAVPRDIAVNSTNITAGLLELQTVQNTIVEKFNALYPLLNSLEGGSGGRISAASRGPTPNPWTNGFDGANVLLDLAAIPSDWGGLLWKTGENRPKTIKEVLLDSYSLLSGGLASVRNQVENLQEGDGAAAYDDTLLKAWIRQIAADTLSVSQGNNWAWPEANFTGLPNSTSNFSLFDRIEALRSVVGGGLVAGGTTISFNAGTLAALGDTNIYDALAALDTAIAAIDGFAGVSLDADVGANLAVSSGDTIKFSGQNGIETTLVVDANEQIDEVQIALTNSGAAAGTYDYPRVTVDVFGRITGIQSSTTEYDAIVDPGLALTGGSGYHTIQAAITAVTGTVVDLATGKGANIWIKPGDYTEDLTIGPGISLHGGAGSERSDSPVLIIGAHKITPLLDYAQYVVADPPPSSRIPHVSGWRTIFKGILFSNPYDANDIKSVFSLDETAADQAESNQILVEFIGCSRSDVNTFLDGGPTPDESTTFFSFISAKGVGGSISVESSKIYGGFPASAGFADWKGGTFHLEGTPSLFVKGSTIGVEEETTPARDVRFTHPAIHAESTLDIRDSDILGGILLNGEDLGGGNASTPDARILRSSISTTGYWNHRFATAAGPQINIDMPCILVNCCADIEARYTVLDSQIGTIASEEANAPESGDYSISGVNIVQAIDSEIKLDLCEWKGGRAGTDPQILSTAGEKYSGTNSQLIATATATTGSKLWTNRDPGQEPGRPFATQAGHFIQGKLTVTGQIDPTAVIWTEEKPDQVVTGAGYGALFVSDGTAQANPATATIQNKMYYKNALGELCEICSPGGGGTSTWTESGSDVYYSGGNVGIGTATPVYDFHVDGDAYITNLTAENFGWGSTHGAFGVPNYRINEFTDTLWRSDIRFGSTMDGSGHTVSSVAATEGTFYSDEAAQSDMDLPLALFDGDYNSRIDLELDATHTFVIVLRDHAGTPTTGIDYPQGKVHVSFYHTHANFDSVKLRAFKLTDKDVSTNEGTWEDCGVPVVSITDSRNISAPYSGSGLGEYAVLAFDVAATTWLTAFELTIETGTAADPNNVMWHERCSPTTINYYQDRISHSQSEIPYLSKYRSSNRIHGRLLINEAGGDMGIVGQQPLDITGSQLSIGPSNTSGDIPLGVHFDQRTIVFSNWGVVGTVNDDSLYFTTDDTIRGQISGSGKWGIGTGGTPATILHVRDADAKLTLQGSGSNTSANTAINFMNNVNDVKWQIGSNKAIGDGLEINAGDSANSRIYIKTTGEVGIGENDPDFKLHVCNQSTIGVPGYTDPNGALQASTINTTQATLCVQDSGAKFFIDGNSAFTNGNCFIGTAAGNYLSLATSAIERIHILADGDVGIGTRYPSETLEVNGAINVGTTTSTNEGSVRFTGTDFEGYMDGEWVSLTAPRVRHVRQGAAGRPRAWSGIYAAAVTGAAVIFRMEYDSQNSYSLAWRGRSNPDGAATAYFYDRNMGSASSRLYTQRGEGTTFDLDKSQLSNGTPVEEFRVVIPFLPPAGAFGIPSPTASPTTQAIATFQMGTNQVNNAGVTYVDSIEVTILDALGSPITDGNAGTQSQSAFTQYPIVEGWVDPGNFAATTLLGSNSSLLERFTLTRDQFKTDAEIAALNSNAGPSTDGYWTLHIRLLALASPDDFPNETEFGFGPSTLEFKTQE